MNGDPFANLTDEDVGALIDIVDRAALDQVMLVRRLRDPSINDPRMQVAVHEIEALLGPITMDIAAAVDAIVTGATTPFSEDEERLVLRAATRGFAPPDPPTVPNVDGKSAVPCQSCGGDNKKALSRHSRLPRRTPRKGIGEYVLGATGVARTMMDHRLERDVERADSRAFVSKRHTPPSRHRASHDPTLLARVSTWPLTYGSLLLLVSFSVVCGIAVRVGWSGEYTLFFGTPGLAVLVVTHGWTVGHWVPAWPRPAAAYAVLQYALAVLWVLAATLILGSWLAAALLVGLWLWEFDDGALARRRRSGSLRRRRRDAGYDDDHLDP